MRVIFGNAGHAREIAYILREKLLPNTLPNTPLIDYYILKEPASTLMTEGISHLMESEFIDRIKRTSERVECYLGVGDTMLRHKLWHTLSVFDTLLFPNLIANGVSWDKTAVMLGAGNIFMPGSLMTTRITIGHHNHFNVSSSISHDCQIGNFNALSPGVRIAGNVQIGNHNFFGVNAAVINNIHIADRVVVGAGAVVTKDITEPGVYAGIPAKKLR